MNKATIRAITAIGALFVALPALAGPPRHYPRGPRTSATADAGDTDLGSFRLRLGLFTPRGNSSFWDDNSKDFTGDASDFRDVDFGGDLLWSINRNLSIMFSTGYWEGSARQYYRDPQLSDLGHDSKLSETPLTVAFVVYPAGRKVPVAPYLGVGGGLYWWRYEETGSFWDFDLAQETRANYSADGVAGGYFLLAGLDVPIRPHWSFFAEGKWQQVGATLNRDFEGFGRIDLSGSEFSGGFSWKF